jgi:hypothetical protein
MQARDVTEGCSYEVALVAGLSGAARLSHARGAA